MTIMVSSTPRGRCCSRSDGDSSLAAEARYRSVRSTSPPVGDIVDAMKDRPSQWDLRWMLYLAAGDDGDDFAAAAGIISAAPPLLA
mmetsp:Transcript_21900/g.48951  ORF Transcript_21900/g.48951 Transcript_21900/m.48951 type:complete len:86 (-) Transcript_21900:757-1014(-)